MPDRQLNAGRKRRLLASLDKALAARGVRRKRTARRPAAETEQRRQRAGETSRTARRSYLEFSNAVRSLGGIRPNRDYKASEIPRELRATRGRGLPPDEMADTLQIYGFQYEGDSDLFRDIERRREVVHRAREGGRKRKNPSTVCADLRRDSRGRFVSHR